jgi:hypothetical protein
LKERTHFQNLVVDKRKNINWTFKIYGWRILAGLIIPRFGSRVGGTVAGRVAILRFSIKF